LWWTEFHPVFPFSLAPPLLLHIFSLVPTSNSTIISLEPCALNADFQHFIPKLNKISLFYGYPWKKGLGWKEAQRQGEFTNNYSVCIYTYMPSNHLHWLHVSVNIYIYTLQEDKCKCKKIGHVTVNDLHLHWIYALYIWLLTRTCTTLV
jgi:hypothetical protein